MTPTSHGSTPAFTLKQKIGLVLGPLLFTCVFFFIEPEGLSAAGRGILASTLWIAAWWVTEAIPIAATSLLPLVLFPLTGGLELSQTSSAYGHRIIFLFLGGFIIAVAIERWGLHRRFALNIIKAMGTATRRIILGFMIATGVLSMWISNTASSLMMLPIGLAVIRQLSAMMQQQGESEAQTRLFGKALMLSIAYSASIGGMATLIGTPPNGILAGQVAKLYKVEIGFAEWMAFGLPVSIILLAIAWVYLAWFAFPLSKQEIPGSRGEIMQQLRALGKMSREEFSVLLVFALTALCWIGRSFVLDALIPGINDTTIAIAGAVALFFDPGEVGAGENAARLGTCGATALGNHPAVRRRFFPGGGIYGERAGPVDRQSHDPAGRRQLFSGAAGDHRPDQLPDRGDFQYRHHHHDPADPGLIRAGARRPPLRPDGRRLPGGFLCFHAAGRHPAQRRGVWLRLSSDGRYGQNRVLDESAVNLYPDPAGVFSAAAGVGD